MVSLELIIWLEPILFYISFTSLKWILNFNYMHPQFVLFYIYHTDYSVEMEWQLILFVRKEFKHIFLDSLMFLYGNSYSLLSECLLQFLFAFLFLRTILGQLCFILNCSCTELWQMLRMSSRSMQLTLLTPRFKNPSLYSVVSFLRMFWSQKPFYYRRFL